MSHHTDQQLHQEQQQQQQQSDVVDLTGQVTHEPGTKPSGACDCQELSFVLWANVEAWHRTAWTLPGCMCKADAATSTK